ncbi:MAG: ABC transporter substrate-binding protein [Flavobacteriaceae bacterium]|nr:ABC transporter substrate-binding protein [Flavobacteriaceae bacterium]
MKNIIRVIVLISFVFACKQEKKQVNTQEISSVVKLNYAEGFGIENYKGYSKLSIFNTKAELTAEYIIVKKGNDLSLKTDLPIIKTPISKVIITSTTHVSYLEYLSEENSIIGFPTTKYISSPKTKKLVDIGQITDLGNSNKPNIELIVKLSPDLLIDYSGFNGSDDKYKRLNLPVVSSGAWLEKHPLARAEWVKFFALLYDKQKLGDSIYKEIESKYNNIKEISKTAENIPSVFSGSMFQGMWNVPAGGSYMAKFFEDASTDYVWKDSEGVGSLHLSFESVFTKAKDSDFWFSPGMFYSKEQLADKNKYYTNLKSYKQNNIYNYISREDSGSIMFFELASIRPDLVLADIVKITHPDLLSEYENTFFTKLE